MKPLTKKQRNKVYRKSHSLIKEELFVCHAIGVVLGIGKQPGLDPLCFPELYLFRETDGRAWLSREEGLFSSHPLSIATRECVLEFCIAMTE